MLGGMGSERMQGNQDGYRKELLGGKTRIVEGEFTVGVNEGFNS